jgi:hypothetical protein
MRLASQIQGGDDLSSGGRTCRSLLVRADGRGGSAGTTILKGETKAAHDRTS